MQTTIEKFSEYIAPNGAFHFVWFILHICRSYGAKLFQL